MAPTSALDDGAVRILNTRVLFRGLRRLAIAYVFEAVRGDILTTMAPSLRTCLSASLVIR